MKYNISDFSLDYAHATTIPCDGETLEVGAMTREITKAFFELTITVSHEPERCFFADYGAFSIG
jgi:hypothetical protein